ncbi:MAG TPA: MaoC family dehydratase [Candidatus Acidoferrum sp.]|nr:MaoC family dehydratase [Candidatus Acidoferrum sp.]
MPPIIVSNPEALREFIGRELGASEWFSVSQERIAQFAEATEDRQWIHLDAARAVAESPYGTTIAHGFLTLSLISHFIKDVIAIDGGVRFVVNYGLNRVRFPAPVKVGSRIRARVALASLSEPSDSTDATFSVTVESEGSSKPNCVAEWVVRYYL